MRAMPPRPTRVTSIRRGLHPWSAVFLAAFVTAGCAGAAQRLTADTCTDDLVPPRPLGSRLPLRLRACHYERAFEGSRIALDGPASQSFGAIVIWVDPVFAATLPVGVMVAGVPNLGEVSDMGIFGARLRLDHVGGASGEELIDLQSPLRDPELELVRLDDGLLSQPESDHSVRVSVHAVPGSPNGTIQGVVRTPLLESADGERIERVVGELTLRLPVDVQTAEITLGGPEAIIAGASVVAERDGDRGLTLRLEGAGLRYVGHEIVSTSGAVESESCFGTLRDADTPTREIRCTYDVPFDRVRVGVASEILERRFAFDIDVSRASEAARLPSAQGDVQPMSR